MSAILYFNIFSKSLALDDARMRGLDRAASSVVLHLNTAFRGIRTGLGHHQLIGSAGRQTLIPGSNQLDVLYELPQSLHVEYHQLSHGPAALCADAVSLIKPALPHVLSNPNGTISVNLETGLQVNVTMAFAMLPGAVYFHPLPLDNRWGHFQPYAELGLFVQSDKACNGNLSELCRITRAWRNANSVDLEDDALDFLAYHFIREWEFRGNSYAYYGWMCADFFSWLSGLATCSGSVSSPGNFRTLTFDKSLRQQALKAQRQSSDMNAYLRDGDAGLAASEMSKIFGDAFFDALHRHDEETVAQMGNSPLRDFS